MGFAPIDNGDIVLNATYTQYIAQKQMAEQQAMGMGDEMMQEGDEENEEQEPVLGGDVDSFSKELDAALDEADEKEDEKAKAEAKKDDAKKSKASEEAPTVVEYYLKKDESDKS
jgi:hypothetical protein